MDRQGLDQAVATLLSDLDGKVGGNASVVLYGSAARGDWIPDRSDVNMLIVVDDPSPAALRRLTKTVSDWHERGLMPPLIIGRAEWESAADTFPVELTDMKLAHRVLRGDDPVAGVDVDPRDLRRALEADLRGRLVRLRQAWVRFGDSAAALGGFAASSISSIVVLLRCTAVLLGRDPGKTAADAVAALGSDLGPDAPVIGDIAAHRREPDWSCQPATFVRYLEVLRRAVEVVDRFRGNTNGTKGEA
jgi:predicted nucleotidyltransferase